MSEHEHGTPVNSALPRCVRKGIQVAAFLPWVYVALEGLAQGNWVGAFIALTLGSVCAKVVLRVC